MALNLVVKPPGGLQEIGEKLLIRSVHPRSAVPMQSIYHDSGWLPGEVAGEEECEPEAWLGLSGGRKVEALTEQVLAQRDGHALILLRADLRDDYDR